MMLRMVSLLVLLLGLSFVETASELSARTRDCGAKAPQPAEPSAVPLPNLSYVRGKAQATSAEDRPAAGLVRAWSVVNTRTLPLPVEIPVSQDEEVCVGTKKCLQEMIKTLGGLVWFVLSQHALAVFKPTTWFSQFPNAVVEQLKAFCRLEHVWIGLGASFVVVSFMYWILFRGGIKKMCTLCLHLIQKQPVVLLAMDLINFVKASMGRESKVAALKPEMFALEGGRDEEEHLAAPELAPIGTEFNEFNNAALSIRKKPEQETPEALTQRRAKAEQRSETVQQKPTTSWQRKRQRSDFQAGELVLLWDSRRKAWTGPYELIELVGKKLWTLQCSYCYSRTGPHHTFRLRRFYADEF